MEKGAWLHVAEGVDDPSFQRFYRFFMGWGALLIIYAPYLFVLLIPRHLLDFSGPKHFLTWLPKFWYEANNFKPQFPTEDVHFYFSVMLIVYVVILTSCIVVGMICYRAGLRFPQTFDQSKAWKPFRNFVAPLSFALLMGGIVPMPVGLENNGARGNPFENPIFLPVWGILSPGFSLFAVSAGALWLGREHARLKLDQEEPQLR